jgi:glutathione S-transferase
MIGRYNTANFSPRPDFGRGRAMMKLYQFTFSHYCEKARWALDHKGIAYQPVNLLPGSHLRTVRKLTPNRGLPVLLDDATVIQDSSAIITYLDTKFPSPTLTPSDPVAAREALEWERYLDEHIGVTLRLWFYYHALSNRELALRFILRGAPWHRSALFRLVYPRVREAMMRFMNINADTARQSEERLLAALDRLDGALDGRRFLVGDHFSRADLTACALLSPCCLVADGQESLLLPPAVLESRNKLKGRPFYRWVRRVYDGHRQPPLAGPSAVA